MAYRMDWPKKLSGAMYQVYLVIRGRPVAMLDMLRYDHCVPATEEDSRRMEQAISEDKPGVFVLHRLSPMPSDATHGRWRSFGCEVLEQFADAESAENYVQGFR